VKKVYFISGLGADKRAFSFLDLSFCDPIFIKWITPLKNESLQHYALRLKDQITDPEPVIVGVSFGGMLASEMAKSDPTVHTIIISSNKNKKEFPKILRAGKFLPVYKWMPPSLLKKGSFFRKLLFGPKGKKQKEIFNAILNDTDYSFTKWAIHSILYWDNSEAPKNITHIHGTADKLLPYRLVKADYPIQRGTHLMIMNNHIEISSLLKNIILSHSALST
jgi:pimeloyl-ACP methyl ester carboxylesterase